MSPAVAVAGCGAWGRNHVRTLYELGALAGVVEVLPGLREKIQAEYPGVRVWSTLEQSFGHVEGVVVATPAPRARSTSRTFSLSSDSTLPEWTSNGRTRGDPHA